MGELMDKLGEGGGGLKPCLTNCLTQSTKNKEKAKEKTNYSKKIQVSYISYIKMVLFWDKSTEILSFCNIP
jgi:hypothetical protein